MESDAEKLVRAKGYPYDLQNKSYILYKGQPLPLGRMDLPADMARRKAVLAFGSNGAPAQLRRKFPAMGEQEAIPVLRTVLTGVDVVFAARFARYGAISAMLTPSPGTTLQTYTTFLTPEQLTVMHATELPQPGDYTGYRYGRLRGITAMIEAVGLRHDLFLYHCEAPPLVRADTPIAFAEMTAKDRRFPARKHEDVQTEVAKLLAPDLDLNAFLLKIIDDADSRAWYAKQLIERGRATELPGFTPEKLKPTKTRQSARQK
ncbi:MAG: hypothetical protein EXQ85_07295 [Alphaproteobacteria bacterium]|nr:hypothetical protein [Alphaproteobacteria bacterium]